MTGGATGAIGIGIGTTGGNTSEESSAPNGRTRASRAAEVFHLSLTGRLVPKILDALDRSAIPAADGAPGRTGLIAKGRLPAGVLAGSAHHDHR